MKKYIILIALAFLIIVSYFMFFSAEKIWPKEKIINNVAEVNTTGSGYRDLEGKFIEYEYVDFGSFKLAFYDNKLIWQGNGGYFDGVTAKVIPQVSKVNNDVYFLSWVFPNGGGDNVVVNFKTKKVFAHLHQADAERSTPFELIYGNIICGPSKDCNPPEGSVLNFLKVISLISSNSKKFNLTEMGTMERPIISEHKKAREELFGKIIDYGTGEETITIEIKGDVTFITDKKGVKEYQTHTTKIDTGIYFISWLQNDDFGQHIVFNQNTMKVFDQILLDGTSKETIYEAAIK